MLRAHRQAWAWQDEWNGLTMEDIREIEKQTQLALQQKMGGAADNADDEEDDREGEEKSEGNNTASTPMQGSEQVHKTLAATLGSIEKNEDPLSPPAVRKSSDIPIINTNVSSEVDATPDDSPLELDTSR